MGLGSLLSGGSRRLLFAWLLVGIFFGISSAGILYEPLGEISARIANRNYNGEGFIEILEAVFWLSATIVFARLFMRKGHSPAKKLWLGFFILFSFVAFGEEISWGQHIFSFEAPEAMKVINKQKEVNIHNLNISYLAGLSETSPLYRYFRNFNIILNPLFYLVCGLLWVVFPLLRRFSSPRRFRWLADMPLPAVGTTVFCAFNILLYLVVDKLFFDIGEIFELSLALVAILSAVDAWLQKDPVAAGV